MRQILLWTAAAIVVGVVVIGGAYLLTKPGNGGPPASPITPGIWTPTNVASEGRTLGSASAPVTIDVWGDFRCSGCFAFTMQIEPTVVSDFVATGKAKLVYHDFILIDADGTTESRDAANAALCATDQGKFWLFHDWLFANQSASESPGYFTIDRLVAIGKAAGLNMSTFEPCVRNGTHNGEVQTEQTALPSDAKSTPSIYVNSKLVVNAQDSRLIPTADEIAAAINAVLSPSASPSASTSASVSASASATAPASAAASPSASAAATLTAKAS
jgi:protein-disulfide isomerase